MVKCDQNFVSIQKPASILPEEILDIEIILSGTEWFHSVHSVHCVQHPKNDESTKAN